MWRFRGGSLPRSESIQVLPASNILVVSAATSALAGEYSCIAYHPDGESAYATVKLGVLGEDESVPGGAGDAKLPVDLKNTNGDFFK